MPSWPLQLVSIKLSRIAPEGDHQYDIANPSPLHCLYEVTAAKQITNFSHLMLRYTFPTWLTTTQHLVSHLTFADGEDPTFDDTPSRAHSHSYFGYPENGILRICNDTQSFGICIVFTHRALSFLLRGS